VKILVSWLRDFVEVPVPPKDLAWALHLLGFEVASVEPPPGAPGTDDDAVIDFEITANRPDCLSVLGMAREVATRFGVPLRGPATAAATPAGDPLPLAVSIEAPDLCPRYAAGMADVRVGSSPRWMVQRLHAAGLRSVNNVVDVTNYVLLELGHPMHAFDYERIGGRQLRIRRARPGERVTTLDGQDRSLGEDMLVIADAERATAVAGVMGGHDSEVSLSTRVIALESAYFQPASVRRTSKRLGLSTEASYRFERGADPEAPVAAMLRALRLLEEIGGGTPRPGWIDAFPNPPQRPVVTLREGRVRHVLGHAVSAPETERILAGLGFDPSPAGEGAEGRVWRVRVPGWRGDVAREADLIEEVARHHGYDRLPATFPALFAAPAVPDARLERGQAAQRLVRAAGFSECCTFTFVERAAALPFAPDDEIVPVANPLSEKFAVLRPSLLTGVIDSLAHNRRREQRDVRLFELGSRFTRSGGEVRALGLAWTGAAAAEHWSGSGRPVDFFDIKGVVERLCAGLGLTPVFAAADGPALVRGRAASVGAETPAGTARSFGTIGQLAPAVAEARGLPSHDEVYVAELDLDAVSDLISLGTGMKVQGLPRHPSVVRDISMIVAEVLPAATLRATIHASAPPTLVDVREVARYQGKGVPEGHVSLSFRLTFRDPARTLTDGEVQAATDAIVTALRQAHGATLR
jgi:phenylalanyl-tRNA synthetase beta chain